MDWAANRRILIEAQARPARAFLFPGLMATSPARRGMGRFPSALVNPYRFCSTTDEGRVAQGQPFCERGPHEIFSLRLAFVLRLGRFSEVGGVRRHDERGEMNIRRERTSEARPFSARRQPRPASHGGGGATCVRNALFMERRS